MTIYGAGCGGDEPKGCQAGRDCEENKVCEYDRDSEEGYCVDRNNGSEILTDYYLLRHVCGVICSDDNCAEDFELHEAFEEGTCDQYCEESLKDCSREILNRMFPCYQQSSECNNPTIDCLQPVSDDDLRFCFREID